MTAGTLLCRRVVAADPPVADAVEGGRSRRSSHAAAVGGAVGGVVLAMAAGTGDFRAGGVPGILGDISRSRPTVTVVAAVDPVVGGLVQTVHVHIVRCGWRPTIDEGHFEIEMGGLAAHGGIVGIGLMTDAAISSQPGP